MWSSYPSGGILAKASILLDLLFFVSTASALLFMEKPILQRKVESRDVFTGWCPPNYKLVFRPY